MSSTSDILHEASAEIVRRSRNLQSPTKQAGYIECAKYLNDLAQQMQWNKCPQCKHELNKDGSFCYFCGYNISPPPIETPEENSAVHHCRDCGGPEYHTKTCKFVNW